MLDNLLTSHWMDRLVYVAIMKLCSCCSSLVPYVSVIPSRVNGRHSYQISAIGTPC